MFSGVLFPHKVVNCRMRKLGRDQYEDHEALEDLAKRCCGISILGNVQSLKGYDHEQPAPTA